MIIHMRGRSRIPHPEGCRRHGPRLKTRRYQVPGRYREQKLPDFSGTFLRAASQSLRVHETLATTAIAMRNLCSSVFLLWFCRKRRRKRI